MRDFAGGRSFASGVGAQFRYVQRDLTVAELGLRRHFPARASKLHVAGFRDLIPNREVGLTSRSFRLPVARTLEPDRTCVHGGTQ